MTVYLNGLGYAVIRKRVQRRRRMMGLAEVAPGHQTSQPRPTYPIYPYLLREIVIDIPQPLGYFFVCPKIAFKVPIPRCQGDG